MKKVVLASLLALAGAAFVPVMIVAQQPAGAAGSVQMSQDEYAAYNNATTQTTPAAKAQAFEAYLKAYPKSAVKADVLSQLLYLYTQTGDKANTLSTADRLLEADPNNLRALTMEVYYRRADADTLTDPSAKCSALDKVAQYAQTGMSATKPAGMSDDDFSKLKTAATPTFESAVADDDLCKKDNAGAITALKAEIDANEPQTHAPSPVLQDVFVLAQAYYTSNPPDYLNCAWYATRAGVFAGQFAAQITPLATYCYKKYHGSADGYADLQAAVATSLNPLPACPAPTATASGAPAPPLSANVKGPSCLTISPAPKPEDIVAQTIASTPDLSVLALSDKEFILQYGKPEDADKVFNTIKGKSVEIPNAVVIAATADQLQLAVSDDAVQSKTADFTIAMKEPLKTVPAVGDKVTVTGTYASYTQKPVMITMSDGAMVLPKKPTPVHHAPARKR
jgi:hypothetical protein